MLCQHCNNREATTHIKQTVNSQTYEGYLCSECAKQVMGNEFEAKWNWDFPDLIQSLFSFPTPHSMLTNTKKQCDVCGCTFDDIVISGQVGCSNCYVFFYEQILPSIARIHG